MGVAEVVSRSPYRQRRLSDFISKAALGRPGWRPFLFAPNLGNQAFPPSRTCELPSVHSGNAAGLPR